MADDSKPAKETIAEAKARRAAEAEESGDSAVVGVSDERVTDVLPADLDLTQLESDYIFPNNNRRRIPGVLYLVLAAICFAFWFLTRNGQPVMVNGGVLWAAIGMAAIGLYSLQAGWDLAIDERDALANAGGAAGFPVGHASAQMGWRGLRSRPTWRILLYSAESPPKQRSLVLVDGVDGHIVDKLVEQNPEDWSAYD